MMCSFSESLLNERQKNDFDGLESRLENFNMRHFKMKLV